MKILEKTQKQRFLKCFLNSEKRPYQGERLAENLGISRNAVWKAVTALKEDGIIYPQKKIQVIF